MCDLCKPTLLESGFINLDNCRTERSQSFLLDWGEYLSSLAGSSSSVQAKCLCSPVFSTTQRGSCKLSKNLYYVFRNGKKIIFLKVLRLEITRLVYSSSSIPKEYVLLSHTFPFSLCYCGSEFCGFPTTSTGTVLAWTGKKRWL